MLRLDRLSISNGGSPRHNPKHATEHPRRVASRWLDLDDVCAPVGQYSARGRGRYPYAELDDLDALHWSGNRKSLTETLYTLSAICNLGGFA